MYNAEGSSNFRLLIVDCIWVLMGKVQVVHNLRAVSILRDCILIDNT